jgi:hypothetical protein
MDFDVKALLAGIFSGLIIFVSTNVSAGAVSAEALPAETLRVLALNTEWLWTPNDGTVDGEKYNRGDMSKKAYKTEVQFYVHLIRSLRANLVALSEIENKSVAVDIATLLGPSWNVVFKQGIDTATGQDVALLSTLPVVPGSITDFGFPYGQLPGSGRKKRVSKIVSARYIWEGKILGVITAHLLSKHNDSRKKALNRERQGVALARSANKLAKKSDSLIVLGDLNDYLNSATLRHLMKGAGLQDAGQLAAPSKQKAVWMIDHILIKNLAVESYSIHSLEKFSDHDGVFSVLIGIKATQH